MQGERVRQRIGSGVDGPSRQPQRLFRLQHDGEFGEIETPRPDERPGPGLRRDRDGVPERIAGFAQRHQRERGRQTEI